MTQTEETVRVTLELDLPYLLDARLANDAERRGESVEAVVRRLLEQAYVGWDNFPPPGFGRRSNPENRRAEEIVRELRDEWDKPA